MRLFETIKRGDVYFIAEMSGNPAGASTRQWKSSAPPLRQARIV